MTNNTDEDNKSINSRPKPLVLFLLDGWGVAPKSEANAISLAKMPNTLRLAKEYPALVLFADHGSLNTRYLSIGSGYFYEHESDSLLNLDLSALISLNNLKQLKIFDGERMAALSYFFNGRREEKLINEDWIIVSATDNNKIYDPILSCEKIVKHIIQAVKDGSHDFIVASSSLLDYYATNSNLTETIKASEVLDKIIKRLANEILASDGVLLISSSHGNAEKIKNLATDLEDREMTSNNVPLIFVSEELSGKTISQYDAPDGDLSLLKPAGNLSDLAPTIAHFLQLEKSDFRGQSLILFKQPET